MCDKMAISDYILKIVEKDPFLRLQMRAKEMFNRTIVQMYNRTNVQSYKCTIVQMYNSYCNKNLP